MLDDVVYAFCFLSRMVDFNTTFRCDVSRTTLVAARYSCCIVWHVSKFGVLFVPSKKATTLKLSNVSMCIQSVVG